MTDDTPTPGTPNPDAAPPPPDTTVMRPRGAEQAPAPVVAGEPADPSDPAAPPAPPAHTDPPTHTDPPAHTDPPVQTAAPAGARGGAGLSAAVVAVGSGLLGAAVVISALRSRATDDGDLDWSNFLAGIGASAALLLVALVGALAARRAGGRAREEVVTWPGVVGILAAAVMLNVGVDESDDWMGYLTGGVLVALGALGYVAARRAAFWVVAIVGLVLIYGLLFDDLLADSFDGASGSVVLAAAIGAFVVVVTLLGWLFPTRATTGVAVGVAGLVGYVAIMAMFLISRLVSEIFGGFPLMDLDAEATVDDPFPAMATSGFAEADVWWVLAFAAVLTLFWAAAASLTNHSGFSIAAIAMPTILVPMATVALAVEHPTWWSAALAAAGAVLLLGGIVLARMRGRARQEALEPATPTPYA